MESQLLPGKGVNEAKIGAEIYYPMGLHEQECFRELGHERGEFPVGEAAARAFYRLGR